MIDFWKNIIWKPARCFKTKRNDGNKYQIESKGIKINAMKGGNN